MATMTYAEITGLKSNPCMSCTESCDLNCSCCAIYATWLEERKMEAIQNLEALTHIVDRVMKKYGY